MRRYTSGSRFNSLIDVWESKAAALEQGVIALLRDVYRAVDGDEPVTIMIDKQGGRNFYAPWISTARTAGSCRSAKEHWSASIRCWDSAARYGSCSCPGPTPRPCRSRWRRCSRNTSQVFMPQFNRFWVGHVPGLKPTAGYPADARRFYDAIRPAMKKLGVRANQVWRRK